MKFRWILPILVLTACGSGEKRDFPFTGNSGKNNQPGQNVACPLTYSPIPLLREGATAIPSPDGLPKGRYVHLMAEYYLREERLPEKFKAHFLEEMRSNSILIRKVCADAPGQEDIFEQEFSALESFSILTSGSSYLPQLVRLQGQEGEIRLSKAPRMNPVNGSILPVLQNWDQWKMYSLGGNSYEIRATRLEIVSGYVFRKFLLQRFQFSAE
jgi:hypothetical protein